MAERKERQPGRIPRFRSQQEAAAFWDSHSPEEFPEEFHEVKVSFARPLIKRGVTIKLDEATIEELKEIAKEQGVGPSTLARMWILEHLREFKAHDLRRKTS